ncbi:IclR family transcriptional regulator [Mycolicibacterium brisbanense]
MPSYTSREPAQPRPDQRDRAREEHQNSNAVSMVDRVALILNTFDEPGKHLRLDQIAGRTELPRSSVHRILKQLHKAGLLQHRRDGYALAASPLPVTRMVDHSRLRGVASPTLSRLHADTGLVVHLGVLFGGDVVYLDKVAGRNSAVVPTRVAGHTPAHASALGKTMLAQLPAEDVDAIVGQRLVRCTRATIGDLPTLHRELARIRSRHGLAYDNEELAIGLTSVAAPLRSVDGEVAGLSLSGTVPLHRLQRTAPFVIRAARHISQQLGADLDAKPVPSSAPALATDNLLSRVLRTITSDAWV